MARFKEFIENKGASLSKTAEFLPFYALPFVPDIDTHPSFAVLFTPTWIEDLKGRVAAFVSRMMSSNGKSSQLMQLWDLAKKHRTSPAGGGREDYIAAIELQIAECEEREMQHIDRHNSLQRDYHTLVKTSAELIDSLECCVRGETVSPTRLLAICSKLNDIGVDDSAPATSRAARGGGGGAGGAAGGGHDGDTTSVAMMSVAGLRQSIAASIAAPPVPGLDFSKIQKRLNSLDANDTATLLQALRWQLTRSPAGEKRSYVLHSFVSNDLLGVRRANGAILSLVVHESESVREYATRLVNCFASLSIGRSYLQESTALLEVLRSQMEAEAEDTMVRQNILGTLQKLSLRRGVQSLLIKVEAIKWLLDLLGTVDQLSEYTIEYAVALLMNLCLRSAGKRRCVGDATNILQTLSNLLGHDNEQVRTYIHGTLYSLLSNISIRKAAQAMGMESAIKAQIEVSNNPKLVVQLEYILQQMDMETTAAEEAAAAADHADDGGEDSDDGEEDEADDDDDDNDDLMMADASEGETLKENGGLTGEDLLQRDYINSGADNGGAARSDHAVAARPPSSARATKSSHGRRSKSRADPAQRDEPPNRPLTPGKRPKSSRSRPGTSRSRPGTSKSRPTTAMSSSRSRPASTRSRPASSRSRPASSRSRPATASKTSTMPLPEPVVTAPPPPSKKVLVIAAGQNDGLNEYTNAFSSRPKMPRTPEPK